MPDTTERAPAPGSLGLVQEFVNTRDAESGADELASAAGLVAWLRKHSLPGADGAVTGDDVTAATELREALRAVLRANSGAPPDPAAAALVNRAAEHAPLRLRLDPHGGARLEETAGGRTGVEGALARILAAAYTGMTDGSWTRLKVCASDDCEWAFYDRSRNHSGHWCDMAVCGSRHKVRAYRARHTSG